MEFWRFLVSYRPLARAYDTSSAESSPSTRFDRWASELQYLRHLRSRLRILLPAARAVSLQTSQGLSRRSSVARRARGQREPPERSIVSSSHASPAPHAGLRLASHGAQTARRRPRLRLGRQQGRALPRQD